MEAGCACEATPTSLHPNSKPSGWECSCHLQGAARDPSPFTDDRRTGWPWPRPPCMLGAPVVWTPLCPPREGGHLLRPWARLSRSTVPCGEPTGEPMLPPASRGPGEPRPGVWATGMGGLPASGVGGRAWWRTRPGHGRSGQRGTEGFWFMAPPTYDIRVLCLQDVQLGIGDTPRPSLAPQSQPLGVPLPTSPEP